MYFHKNTERLTSMFAGAIVLVLVIGLIGGIVFGISLGEPTEMAQDAMTEILRDPIKASYLSDDAAEKAFTFTSFLGMLGVWFASALVALLLHAKCHQIQMIDKICGCLKKEDVQEKEAQEEPEVITENN